MASYPTKTTMDIDLITDHFKCPNCGSNNFSIYSREDTEVDTEVYDGIYETHTIEELDGHIDRVVCFDCTYETAGAHAIYLAEEAFKEANA